MSATISFTFPSSTPYKDVLAAIREHFGDKRPITFGAATGAIESDDAPDVGNRNAQEVFTGVPSAAATYTGQPTASTTVAANAVAGQVDKDGLPWDERIHSSSQKVTEKGFWVKRKNVDESTYNAIRAELVARAVNTAPAVGPNGAAANAMHQQLAEKEARILAAYAQATAQLGNYPGDLSNFEALKSGKRGQLTLSPIELSYFEQWEVIAKGLLNPAQPSGVYVPPGNVAPPVTAAQSQPAGVSGIDRNSYPGFAIFVNTAKKAGRINDAQLNDAIAMAGVVGADGQSNLLAVGQNPQAIPGIYGLFEALYQLS